MDAAVAEVEAGAAGVVSSSAFTPSAAKGTVPAAPADEDAVAEPITPGDMTAAPTTPAAVAAPRPPKGLVVLAIGLPGSGKSTWFKTSQHRAALQ